MGTHRTGAHGPGHEPDSDESTPEHSSGSGSESEGHHGPELSAKEK